MRFFGPLVLILLGLAALNCSEAQTASPNPASQTKDNGVFTSENYAGDPYIFELIETQVRFEADGRGQRDLTTRVRIVPSGSPQQQHDASRCAAAHRS
jgi:hypothetical protein